MDLFAPVPLILYLLCIDQFIFMVCLVVMFDYPRIHFECYLTFLIIFIQKAIDQRQHKFIHILLLYLTLQALLHKFILIPFLNINKHVSHHH